MDLKNKKVTVIGLGESGLAAVELLSRAGSIVRVTDFARSEQTKQAAAELILKGVAVELGGHTNEFIDDADLIVVSPGVPPDIPVLEQARNSNIKIISEIELGFLYCKSKIIAVTGTNGKSTVVSLLNEIFNQAGLKAVVCGNISPAFCNVVNRTGTDTTLIMEVSSYQLEFIEKFHPKISIILNITPDHLDHHRCFDKYIRTKMRIFENQQEEDYLIINNEVRNYLKETKEIKPQILTYSVCDKIIDLDKVRLKGRHNQENILAAVLGAKACGIALEHIARALSEFKGLPHRLEYFLNYKGIDFVNDSKATNVEAVLSALEAIEAPIILIAGGMDKELNYGLARKRVKEKVKLLILIGQAKGSIKKALKGVCSLKEASGMEEAVRIACSQAQSKDTVLLSPMCSSFDMFDNFEHRGDVFKSIVEKRFEIAH